MSLETFDQDVRESEKCKPLTKDSKAKSYKS